MLRGPCSKIKARIRYLGMILGVFLALRTADSAAILRSEFSEVHMDIFCTQRMSRKVTSATCALVLLTMLPARAFQQGSETQAPQAQTPQPAADMVEQGKFILHKFENPIGEETYQITRDRDSLDVKMDFKFTDRGTPVPLKATFRAAKDLTPEAFEIKGQNSRVTTIDEEVEVQGAQVRLRDRAKWTEATRPSQFFTIAGYAPTTMQMLMVRFWASHGSPAELATLPTGRVKIEPRGQDAISIDGKSLTLDRFTIEGLIWGRETLWFDSSKNLVASVTTDAEFDHFEAIREGYESALGTFVGRAGGDEMAALTEMAKGISGARSDSITIVNGTLIDGTGKPPIPNATVVIENGKITAAGPRAQIKYTKHAKILDASGKFVLPGLWDMHAHFEQVEWGPIYLAAGATTVRDCGNELEFITAVRDAVANGRGLGPRILAAGVVDGDGPLALGIDRVNNAAQAKEWVDRYHDLGFQQIKIYSSVKLASVEAITAEAHRLGMTVTGHIPEGMNAYEGVEAGMDQINHIQYVADIMRKQMPPGSKRVDRIEATANVDLNSPESLRAIAFLKSHGTVIDPTLVVFESFTVGPDRTLQSLEPGVAKVAPELAVQVSGGGVPPEVREAVRRE